MNDEVVIFLIIFMWILWYDKYVNNMVYCLEFVELLCV